jgi:hypothetical protein
LTDTPYPNIYGNCSIPMVSGRGGRWIIFLLMKKEARESSPCFSCFSRKDPFHFDIPASPNTLLFNSQLTTLYLKIPKDN